MLNPVSNLIKKTKQVWFSLLPQETDEATVSHRESMPVMHWHLYNNKCLFQCQRFVTFFQLFIVPDYRLSLRININRINCVKRMEKRQAGWN
jgi:hypothetical protein